MTQKNRDMNMNKFFIKFAICFIMLSRQMQAAEVPSLKNLCVTAGSYLSEATLQRYWDKIPEDCLKPILIQKIASKLFPLAITQPIETLRGHTVGVNAVAITPDATIGLSGSDDFTVILWDLVQKKQRAILYGHTNNVTCVAITPNGRRGLSGSNDNTIIVWDLKKERKLAILHGHSRPVRAVAITPDGKIGVSGSDDTMIKIWNLDTGTLIATLPGHLSGIESIALAQTPAGTRVLSGDRKGILILWDLDNQKKIAQWDLDSVLVYAVAMTPDGSFGLASAGWPVVNTLILWNLGEEGKEIATMQGNVAIVSLGMSADAKIGLCGTLSKDIIVWNLSTQKQIATLQSHEQDAAAIAMTPDGTAALSGSWDKTLKLWDLRPILIEYFPIEFLKEIYFWLYKDKKSKEEVYQLIVEKISKLDREENRRGKRRWWPSVKPLGRPKGLKELLEGLM